jgi:hypothetical protein
MIKWAIIFAIIAIVAGLLGFGGIAVGGMRQVAAASVGPRVKLPHDRRRRPPQLASDRSQYESRLLQISDLFAHRQR